MWLLLHVNHFFCDLNCPWILNFARILIRGLLFSRRSFLPSRKYTWKKTLPGFTYPIGFLAAWKVLIACSTSLLTVQFTPSTANELLKNSERFCHGRNYSTVKAFPPDTLVSGTDPPNDRLHKTPFFLISHTNSVFLHFRKRPALATDTFFTSRECPLTRASTMYCALYINGELLSSTKKCVQQFTPGTQNYGQISYLQTG